MIRRKNFKFSNLARAILKNSRNSRSNVYQDNYNKKKSKREMNQRIKRKTFIKQCVILLKQKEVKGSRGKNLKKH